jgi:predicted ribosome quality control (RQC) complex YloA/Tae2 family protein
LFEAPVDVSLFKDTPEVFLSLNWKEIDLVLQELKPEGARIQKVFQSSYDILALQIRLRSETKLILAALTPGSCRIHETFRPVPKSETPLRFAEFLKSRIVNGTIEEAVQLGDNRIVRIIVRRGGNRYRLYIRLWSNAANVIVTGEDGTILDAMRRLPRRGEISGGRYEPESSVCRDGAGTADNYAVRTFTAEAGGGEDGTEGGELSFNKQIDSWYAEQQGKLSLDQLKPLVRKTIGTRMEKLGLSLERLRVKEADYASAGRYREYGDIIMANIAAIPEAGKPAGGGTEKSFWFETENFSGERILLELDRTKTPVENAEAYYEKYRKAKNGLEEIREEIREGEAELARLGAVEQRLLDETNPLVLEGLLRKFRESAKRESSKKRPGLSFNDGEWLFLVGRDAKENDQLLRRHVRGNDFWLHVRDYPGSYVFIKYRPGKTVPLEILLEAGNLALFYSKGRNNGSGNIYYTQVKYLRRAKNGPKGLVLPTQEKNLFIRLDQKLLKKLEFAKHSYYY